MNWIKSYSAIVLVIGAFGFGICLGFRASCFVFPAGFGYGPPGQEWLRLMSSATSLADSPLV